MRLKEEFVVQQLSDQQIIVPVGEAAQTFHGIVRANDTAGFIVDCLKEETTEKQIVDKMLKEYEVDRETAAAGVKKVIAQLNEIGALEI